MKKTVHLSEQDRRSLEQLDALVGSAELTDAELAAELAECGVDAQDLKKTAFQAVRAYATTKYSSQGLNVPPLMSEALRQMRPPTSEELEVASEKRATSRVQNLLASVRGTIDSFPLNLAPAPAFRNKQSDTPSSDDEILDRQQKDLDRKTKRANDD